MLKFQEMELLDKQESFILNSHNTIDYEEVMMILKEFDKEFNPIHSSLVNHENYALKLANNAKVITAYYDKTLVAVVFYYENILKHDIYITYLCVKSNYRRFGVSSKIIEFLSESYIPDYQTISLMVRKDNIPAFDFYQANEFSILSQTEKSFLMTKILK